MMRLQLWHVDLSPKLHYFNSLSNHFCLCVEYSGIIVVLTELWVHSWRTVLNTALS